MRKIEQEMVAAIKDSRNWTAGNTSVMIDPPSKSGEPGPRAAVLLHGKVIAVVRSNGELSARRDTFRAWPTATTASRLRALGVNASIRNGRAHIDGEPA
jgi:hypothetical protein